MKIFTILGLAVGILATGMQCAISAEAAASKAVCAITSGLVGGKKFATLKCYKKDEPGNYKIRNTVWERKDAKAYRDLAKFAGARFTCTMKRSGESYTSDSAIKKYELTDCRR